MYPFTFLLFYHIDTFFSRVMATQSYTKKLSFRTKSM